MSTQENLQFKINSLRQDKIIYGVEAGALNLACLFVFFFSLHYFNGSFQTVINRLDLIVAIGYTLYMGYGNTKRLLKIQKLEKELGN